MADIKGPGEKLELDGRELRIAIVHARWNTTVITALVNGAKQALVKAGVKENNIAVQSVPGSFELPFGVRKAYEASKIQASKAPTTALSAVTDLLSSASATDLTQSQNVSKSTDSGPLRTPFDAIIAIGVLIKGETMHFEYISEATGRALMDAQLDLGIPVIFGLLTTLNEEQAKARAGLSNSHCHGEDWGSAAVEMAIKNRGWVCGDFHADPDNL